MGNSASKAARQFPKAKSQAQWAGARTPAPGEPGHPGQRAGTPRASEIWTEDIERDARDPQFMANLSKLGPVRVDHHMRTYQLGQDMAQQLSRAQRESETDAFSARPSHNRLHASTLQELLEERKTITSRSELEQLCQRYSIDVERLENVGRFVVMTAAWTEPPPMPPVRPLVGSST